MLKIFVEEAAALASITLFVSRSCEARAAPGEKPDDGSQGRVPSRLRKVEASPLRSESGLKDAVRRTDHRCHP